MMQPNFNTEGEPEGEDRGSLLWNEYHWQQYLKANEAEIKKFLELYLKNRHEPNHLDVVAQKLGWGQMEWVTLVEESEDDDENWVEDMASEDMMMPHYSVPYTVHRHPIFMVTRGLILHLSRIWQYCFSHHNQAMPPLWAWNFFNVLHLAEINALMAVQAVDLGDFHLSICHFKNGLSAINQSFKLLSAIPGDVEHPSGGLIQDTKLTLFDLRDVWLRVMRECREEIKFENEEFDGSGF